MLPKKEAMFRLNRVSMKITTMYIFILIFILNIPSQITLLLEKGITELPRSSYITQILIFYPFVIFFSAIIGISFIAFISLLLTKLLKRKLTFQQLWKMSAYASTSPLLLYTLMNQFVDAEVFILFVFLIMLFFILFKMICIYPKRTT